MTIYQFMERLTDALHENGFYCIEGHKQHIEHKNEFLLRIKCKKDNKNYNYNYILDKKLLDDITIQEIVYNLSMEAY